jgi:DNA-directed RNA polymerase subunit K/omega
LILFQGLKIISIHTKMSDYEGSDNEDIYKNVSDSDTDVDSDTEEPEIKKITPKKILSVESDNSDNEGEVEDENEYGKVDAESEIESNLDVDSVIDSDADENLDDDIEDGEEEGEEKKSLKKTSTPKLSIKTENYNDGGDDGEDGNSQDSEEEDEDEDENYQKFDSDMNKNYVVDFHPECMIHNYDEISVLTKIHRDKNNVIIDSLHRTLPFLTKYERARVLGQRAKQINSGARPFVKIPENIIDGHLIADLELQQKRIPFIIRRPLPGAGSEYWNLKDLELISF